ncbi:MAG TPA: hypothetical protein VNO55_14755, partial [Polyangia bacterium]|nr:hypothetical protein [Polyangia bacterium]
MKPSDAEQKATAERLLRAARGYDPPVHVTFAEIQTAVRVQRRLSAGLPARLAVAGAFGLCVMLVMGGVALSRGWLGWRPRAAAPTVITVPAGATTRVERRGRFRMALRGPGAMEIGGGGNDESLSLQEGKLELENQERTVTVEATGRHVEVSPSSTVTIDLPKQGTLQVGSVAGQEPRIDGAPTPARATAPAAAPAPAPAPAPTSTAAAPVVPVAPAALPKVTPRQPVSERTVHSGAATEVTQMRDALARLRTERDPAGALALLDDYDRRFPGGLLRDEAAATRIEALLAVGQSTEALERLESIPTA